jgi:plastocyanin
VKVVSPIPRRHWPVPAEPVTIASVGCRFEPYVSAIQAGQRLLFVNRDSVLHNVHASSSLGEEKNYAMMPKSKPLELRVEHADAVRINCDVHPWEFAYVTKVEHPYFAVTDAEGKFEIKGLREGKYTVEATHRKAGTDRAVKVEVGRDGGWVDFRLQVPAQK